MEFFNAIYPAVKHINALLGSVLSAMLIYRTAYIILGFLFTRHFAPAKKKHKYGVVIAARNEEAVLGNLLDSINKQDYPPELVKVFVVADNCTDTTAQIARQHGAVCYERFDNAHRTKGFALEFLFDRIEEDYGRQSFDGYFVFDADNLLKRDYISRMNDAFDSGEKIITSYRNTKNFDESWIASNYALHWLRSIRVRHRARSVLRLATNIQGTGFLFSNEIVRDGWHYTSLTEDRALTADAVAQGYRISYQDKAEFFDEQPTNLKIAIRQRVRWAKGHLQAFAESGPYLALNVIFGKLFLRKRWTEPSKKQNKVPLWKKIVESVRHRFASFDTLMQLTPFSVLHIFRWLLVSLLLFSLSSVTAGLTGARLFAGGTYLARLLRFLFPVLITVKPGAMCFVYAFLLCVLWRILYRVGMYFENLWLAVYVLIMERRHIQPMPWYKLVIAVLTWPLFDIIGRYSTYAALFMKVEWKPIPHKSAVTINDLQQPVPEKVTK